MSRFTIDFIGFFWYGMDGQPLIFFQVSFCESCVWGAKRKI